MHRDRDLHRRRADTLDGYGSYREGADWGGYWGKQGPEFLARWLATFDTPQRMVFGATTFRQLLQMWGEVPEGGDLGDPSNARMRRMPATVVSSTLEGPLDWPDVTVVRGDAVDVVARLKQESAMPLRSFGSLSLNWALLAAGVVDRLQVTVFPVISGLTGTEPVFAGAGDVDLALLESHTLDGGVQELTYRPTRHG